MMPRASLRLAVQLLVVGSIGVLACRDQGPTRPSAVFDMTWVSPIMSVTGAQPGPVPYMDVIGDDTAWTLGGTITLYPAEAQYEYRVEGRVSLGGRREDRVIVDSGIVGYGGACTTCVDMLFVSDLGYTPDGRFITAADTSEGAAYYLGGIGGWSWSFARRGP